MKLSKQSWIGFFLLALTIGALFALNTYVLDMTQGCYNVLDILFI